MANPSKSMEGAVNYLCVQIQKSGLCCIDDATVMNILVHYYPKYNIIPSYLTA
ncbi:Cas9 inhibitor AcrIIA9 family protein [Bacteroides acidifaciens]|uniref:Cas9 inhibitor AcrIIA9 family protein n=1 Tax=Bacteroides acidifaciens TaxID=85831 RepID=UPI0033356A1D